MKKHNSLIFTFISLVLSVVLFFGCELSISFEDLGLTGLSSSTTVANELKTWNYDSSLPFYRVDDKTLSLTIDNLPSGKTLYLVQVNPTEEEMSVANLRSIESTSRSAILPVQNEYALSTPALDGGRRYFVEPPLPAFTSSARSIYDISALTPSYSISGTVGETKKIYVDTDNSMKVFKQKDATLRYVGTNCYVWVVDDYYATTAYQNKVDSTIAKKYGQAFDSMYEVITNLFGKESDKIVHYDSQTLVDMASFSDTGTKVNIVIYDIANDYSSLAVSTTGIAGYFYSKDYYYAPTVQSSTVSKSNVGKYFYMDSGFAVSDFDSTISTLAHEFQHMINFNQKNITNGKSPSAYYNEMLSMLCEDLMQDFLGLEDKYSPKNRMSDFNSFYWGSGVCEYREDDYAVLSYSTSYAFGSFLARNYGGAALVKEISQNAYVDEESIVKAVNKVNSTSYTFDDLFARFLLAITKNSNFTHNKSAATSLTYSNSSTTYSYPLSPIDIFASEYELASDTYSSLSDIFYSSYNRRGPMLFNTHYGPSSIKMNSGFTFTEGLRSDYGIAIYGIKTTSAGKEKLTFSSSGATGLQLYVIVQ